MQVVHWLLQQETGRMRTVPEELREKLDAVGYGHEMDAAAMSDRLLRTFVFIVQGRAIGQWL